MAQDHLASKEKLTPAFDTILKGRISPAFQRDGRGTVSQAPQFVEDFLTAMDRGPTTPAETKRWVFYPWLSHFSAGSLSKSF